MTTKRIAYVPVSVDSKFGAGLAQEDEPGFWPLECPTFDTYEEAVEHCRQLNAQYNISDETRIAVQASSMAAQNRRNRINA